MSSLSTSHNHADDIDSTYSHPRHPMPETTFGKETTDQVVSVSSPMPKSLETNGKWESRKLSSRTRKHYSTSKANETSTGTLWHHVSNEHGGPTYGESTKQRPKSRGSGKGRKRLWYMLERGIMGMKCLLGGKRGGDSVCWE